MMFALVCVLVLTVRGSISADISQQQLNDLVKRVERLENENVALKTQNEDLSTKLSDIEQSLPDKQPTGIVSVQNSPVMFMAGVLETKAYSIGDIIQFPKLLLGSTSYYDNVTSEFICPFHGIYTFNVVLSTTVGYTIFGSLQHQYAAGGSTQHSITVCNNVYDEICQSAHSSLVECFPGDVLYVMVKGETLNQHVHDNINHYSTFSGYLLALIN